jgi:hypothetical protein
MVIDVPTDAGTEHFTVNHVSVYATAAAAVPAEKPGEANFISFVSERSWKSATVSPMPHRQAAPTSFGPRHQAAFRRGNFQSGRAKWQV